MTTAVPKFRSVRRLVAWVQNNWSRLDSPRLPSDVEQVFFRTKMDTPDQVAKCVSRYSRFVGKLESEFENLLKPHHDALVDYITNVEGKVDLDLLSVLSGDSRSLYRVSQVVGRLPQNLEITIREPRYAFLYAREVLCGRLPAEMESVFFGDPYHAAKYAFEVIRGFSSCKLPEALHSMMIMASFEDPENDHIKMYLQASESDPSKFGNSKEKVR